MMDFLVWNSRGAASKTFASVLKELRHRYKVDVVVILELRISGATATKVIKSCEAAEATSPEFVAGSGKEVYEPWLVAGDFNEIKSPMEQKGGGRVNENQCHVFNEWIQQCELVDMEPKGPFFTWQGPKWDGLERVFKRLDRCLCNVKWLELFEDAEVRIIPRVGSDHHPMLVKLKREPFSFGVRRFRFELAWQMHNGFQDFLTEHWRAGDGFSDQLTELQHSLQIWNREVFGKIEYRLGQVWPEVVSNLVWEIGDGGRIRFWDDHWVGAGVKMAEKCTSGVPDGEINKTVKDMLKRSSGGGHGFRVAISYQFQRYCD
ncbi:hypothetical protein K1719_017848 [Acacia pycnantha]|nr:hypothetical protein K1719_017848 [Acacia pycnantha]